MRTKRDPQALTDREEARLWKRVRSAHAPTAASARKQLIERYLPLALTIADRIQIPLDTHDKHSAAQLALLQSVDKFEADRGHKFSTFLACRVRGEVLDTARKGDWMTRVDRLRWHKALAIADGLVQQLGRFPSDDEIAAAGGDPKYLVLAVKLKAASVDRRVFSTHFDDGHGHANADDLRAQISVADFDRQQTFDQALRGLPMDSKIIVYLYYVKQQTMKRIGEVLLLSESRVSQLHSQAMDRLRREGGDELKALLARG